MYLLEMGLFLRIKGGAASCKCHYCSPFHRQTNLLPVLLAAISLRTWSGACDLRRSAGSTEVVLGVLPHQLRIHCGC